LAPHLPRPLFRRFPYVLSDSPGHQGRHRIADLAKSVAHISAKPEVVRKPCNLAASRIVIVLG
jgi:hypothetical protein